VKFLRKQQETIEQDEEEAKRNQQLKRRKMQCEQQHQSLSCAMPINSNMYGSYKL
jgi:hypothetical protein